MEQLLRQGFYAPATPLPHIGIWPDSCTARSDMTPPVPAMNADTSPKRALLIGIDEYDSRADWGRLRGCENDANALRDVLVKHFGFPRERCPTLLGDQATRQNIISHMETLLAECEDGAIVVFAFAGHGSLVNAADASGPMPQRECMVPYDSLGMRRPERDIADDEIREWLLKLCRKTPNITLIFDCCHAGTLTRGEQVRPERPLGILLPCADRYVALSACREEELAGEALMQEGGRTQYHGTFSRALLRALGSGTLRGRSYIDLMDVVAAEVTQTKADQHPRLEGAVHRQIFGTRDVGQFGEVPILWAGPRAVRMQAGSLHGVRPGSEWSPVPTPGMPAAARLLRLRVTQVWSAESDAVVIVPASDSETERAEAGAPCLHLPCRLRHVASRDELRRWACLVDVSAGGLPWGTLLQSSPWLRPSQPGEQAQVHISLCRADERPNPTRLAAAAPPPAGRMLRFADALGGLLLPSIPLDEADLSVDSLAALLAELELLARCDWLGQLQSTDPQLAAAMEMQMLSSPSMSRVPLHKPGRVRVLDGDSVFLELRNQAREALYVTLLVISSDRRITQIYPPPGSSSQKIAAGRSIRIGSWQLRLPHPDLLPPIVAGRGERPIDILKLFVTPDEVNFHSVLHPTSGSRLPGAGNIGLGRITQCITGLTSRGQASGSVEDRAWGCQNMEVEILPL